LEGFAGWVRGLALSLGAPGLYLVAFLDSSFLSLPEITDILVVLTVTRNQQLVVIYVIAATLGSLTGCLLMYFIGRKGGEALIRKRFSPDRVERAMAAFERFGVMVVLIPSILPPPAPFKIFVLMSGVAGISLPKFVAAIAIGRGARYSTLGVLAIWYGEVAIAYLREHGVAAALAVVAVLAVGLAGYVLWRKAQRAKVR
jgi:membrane protein YqaA with SNARE-associated domain